MSQGSAGADDIWVRDLVRGVTSRFTFNEETDRTPCGRRKATALPSRSEKDGDYDLAVKAVGGTGEVEVLLEAEGRQRPSSWSPDGKHLLYYNVDPETSWDINVIDLEGEPNPRPFIKTPFVEIRGRFSPDGRWVAYQSNESGQSEIYVQAFPGPGGKWQISTAGGAEPQWGPDGKELFYRSPDRQMMRVDVQTRGAFEAGIPEAMFTASLRPITTNNRYLVSPDGQRFLLLSSLVEDTTPPTTVVVNWTAELGER